MKRAFSNIISKKPIFLYLLPLFFVLHGYTENYNLVPARDAFILFVQYLAIAFVLSLLSWLYFRNFYKANLFGFFLLSFQFFFGNVHDLLKKWFADSFITRYSFIIPFMLILFLLILLLLKRNKKPFLQSTLYLNSLLLILIIVDAGQLIFKAGKPVLKSGAENISIIKCDTCNTPDIYLIIADGYPGKKELNDLFGYDNTPFLNELKKRKFHIVDSSISNYNFTPFSMASMLDMNYLNGISGSNSNKQDISVCYNTLKKSSAYTFLLSKGYDFYNYSIFDFPGQPSIAKPTFLIRKTKLITSQTFLYRINKEIGFHLATTFKLNFVLKYLRNFDLKNNNKLYSLTKEIALKPITRPKFVYTHLVMPHYPYYFDSLGHQASYHILTDDYSSNPGAFISYLKYSNKKFIELTDYVLAHSSAPPIIILMSDHGFREFKEPVDQKYHFMNLNSIFLPDSNYAPFYNGMSNINQFRVLLNSQFGQQLPILKDSTSFLNE